LRHETLSTEISTYYYGNISLKYSVNLIESNPSGHISLCEVTMSATNHFLAQIGVRYRTKVPSNSIKSLFSTGVFIPDISIQTLSSQDPTSSWQVFQQSLSLFLPLPHQLRPAIKQKEGKKNKKNQVKL
jgi:hypothetical protein